MAANGCEVDLNSASNCGACGNVCAGQCVAGVCTEWLRRVGEAANISNETGWDSAEDRAGNVYFTGSFDNQTNFGAGPVSGTMGTGFVVSYTPRGVVRWVRTFDSAGYDEARTVTVRTVAGRVKVLVAGNASGSLNLGGNVVGGGVSTFFIVEYDDAGALQWSTVMQAQRNPFGAIIDSAMSASGDVYITGGTTTFTIEGNTIQNAIFANNGTTAFVMKLNPMGVHQWTRWIGAPLVDSAGRAVALDSANNMVVAVEGHDVMDAGGGPRGFMGSSFDMLLAKYDSNNVHQWSTVFNDSGISLLSTVAINQFNDEITIAGHHSGSVDFGGAMVGAPPPASYNTFVVNIAANGNAGRPVATLARSYITNTVHAAAYPTLAYTSDSRLFLSDSYSGVPMIGGVAVAPGAGLREYIAEIDTGTLNLTSVMNFTGTNTNETHSITGCGAGFVCTTGGFRPNVSFGMATVSAAPGLSNYDVYFARIARP